MEFHLLRCRPKEPNLKISSTARDEIPLRFRQAKTLPQPGNLSADQDSMVG